MSVGFWTVDWSLYGVGKPGPPHLFYAHAIYRHMGQDAEFAGMSSQLALDSDFGDNSPQIADDIEFYGPRDRPP